MLTWNAPFNWTISQHSISDPVHRLGFHNVMGVNLVEPLARNVNVWSLGQQEDIVCVGIREVKFPEKKKNWLSWDPMKRSHFLPRLFRHAYLSSSP